jgi:hypothetical protein
VAQVATAITTENGETVVLVINKPLYFGNSMDHSLINPNRIQAFGIEVSDNPYDEVHRFGVSHEDWFSPSKQRAQQCISILSSHQMTSSKTVGTLN